MNLSKVLSVMWSCKNVDQLTTCIAWASRILRKEDCKAFIHMAQRVPNFDIAIHRLRHQE